jgi:hypothetical protein
MKIGDNVKQVVHPIEGVIASKRFDEVTDTFQYLLEYTDKDGEETSRWFNEDEIEAVIAKGGK